MACGAGLMIFILIVVVLDDQFVLLLALGGAVIDQGVGVFFQERIAQRRGLRPQPIAALLVFGHRYIGRQWNTRQGRNPLRYGRYA